MAVTIRVHGAHTSVRGTDLVLLVQKEISYCILSELSVAVGFFCWQLNTLQNAPDLQGLVSLLNWFILPQGLRGCDTRKDTF